MTDISFTISTDGKSDDRINLCIDSIENLKIPNYEIIIVGGLETSIKRKNVFHLPFYEQTKTGTPWMSKKKNLSIEFKTLIHIEICFNQNSPHNQFKC